MKKYTTIPKSNKVYGKLNKEEFIKRINEIENKNQLGLKVSWILFIIFMFIFLILMFNIKPIEGNNINDTQDECKGDRLVYKKGFSRDHFIHNRIQYAYCKGGLDFMLTLNAENGSWSIYTDSNINSNGTRDYGLCQLNSAYHSKFIKSEDFKDPYKQIDYCYGVWQDAIKKGRLRTTFYGYNHRYERKTNLEFVNKKEDYCNKISRVIKMNKCVVASNRILINL